MTAMNDEIAKRTNVAARVRAFRMRRRSGTILVHLDISAAAAHTLHVLGWLAPGDEENPTAIASAILALGGAALAKGLRAPK